MRRASLQLLPPKSRQGQPLGDRQSATGAGGTWQRALDRDASLHFRNGILSSMGTQDGLRMTLDLASRTARASQCAELCTRWCILVLWRASESLGLRSRLLLVELAFLKVAGLARLQGLLLLDVRRLSRRLERRRSLRCWRASKRADCEHGAMLWCAPLAWSVRQATFILDSAMLASEYTWSSSLWVSALVRKLSALVEVFDQVRVLSGRRLGSSCLASKRHGLGLGRGDGVSFLLGYLLGECRRF